ncbi:hypothetical protein QUW59_06735 [Phocaeicola salanitronis]|nr:hypothetical protein [Phocaeicola salanitronis]
MSSYINKLSFLSFFCIPKRTLLHRPIHPASFPDEPCFISLRIRMHI